METRLESELGFLQSENYVWKSKEEYWKLLLTCSIACRSIYHDKPKEALASEYGNYKHNITKVCVSQTVDDIDQQKSTLDTKYMICDTSFETKTMIVAFRGTHGNDDLLYNIKAFASPNDTVGLFHSGFYAKAKKIPIQYFVEKIQKEGFNVIFTGHSLGGAVAALVAHRCSKALLDQSNHVQFIGFGVPLIGDKVFSSLINHDGNRNRFHFYVFKEDPIPRILSIVSELLKSDNQKEQDTMKTLEFFKKLIEFTLKLDEPASWIDNFKDFVQKIGNIILKNITPNYEAFGNHIYMLEDVDDEIYGEQIEQVQVLKLEENANTKIYTVDGKNWSEMTKNLISKLQHHRMASYFEFLERFFKKNIPQSYASAESSWISSILKSSDTSPTKIDCKQCLNLKSEWILEEEIPQESKHSDQWYNIDVFVNELSADIILTLFTPIREYVMSVELESFKLTKVDPSNEYVVYIFEAPLDEIVIKDGKFKRKSLDMTIVSHFNTITTKLELKGEPNHGLSVKEDAFSKLPLELLYLYAITFIVCTNGRHGKVIDERRSELGSQLTKLDQLLRDDQQDISSEFLQSVLMKHCLEVSSKVNEGYDKQFEFNFRQRQYDLKESQNERDFTKVVENTFYTIYKYKKSQCKHMTLSLNTFQNWGIGSIASVSLAALAIPGINIIGALVLGVIGISNLGYLAYTLSNVSNLMNEHETEYQRNLNLFYKTFSKKDNSFSNFYSYEAFIYEHCMKIGLLTKRDNHIYENWNSFFGKSTFFGKIDKSQRSDSLKILKCICINYQLRKTLISIPCLGVVGTKKSGKSTLIENLLLTDSGASSSVATTQITPHIITQDVCLFDYPHYESQKNISHKVQFLASRFILDHVYIVFDALYSGDTDDVRTQVNLIKKHGKFTVFFNRSDAVWKDKKKFLTNDEMESKRLECASLIDVDEKDVYLSCFEIENVNLMYMEQFRQIDTIKDIKFVRNLTLEKLKDICLRPGYIQPVAVDEMIKSLELKFNELNMLDIVNNKVEMFKLNSYCPIQCCNTDSTSNTPTTINKLSTTTTTLNETSSHPPQQEQQEKEPSKVYDYDHEELISFLKEEQQSKRLKITEKQAENFYNILREDECNGEALLSYDEKELKMLLSEGGLKGGPITNILVLIREHR